MGIISIKENANIPKYKQIVVSIENAIMSGSLRKGDKLPSLNSIKNQFSLSRDTVLSAFNELKTRGIVQSIVGKGYYVLSEYVDVNQKVFLLFDEFNSFKEDLYSSFLAGLRKDIEVDIFFHHFNFEVFSKLIHDHAGRYDFYVIMPANLKGTAQIIKRLPHEKVFILDQTNSELSNYPAVYQNFKKDIYQGLLQCLTLLKKYQNIVLLFTLDKQPKGILDGFVLFCNNQSFQYEIISDLKDRILTQGEVYILLEDKNLISIIKNLKQNSDLVLAEHIGIISYNDSLLKEIVCDGITTISTDFKLMGNRLASMISNQESAQIENPNKVIIRNSL
jgi:DNA-binding transcriptional regulator YhcF (GntR family)